MADNVQPEDSRRPNPIRRTSSVSISNALNRFAGNAFSRRRTVNELAESTSPGTTNNQTQLPAPAGISRSNSFFSRLNKFSPRATPVTKDHPRVTPTGISRSNSLLSGLNRFSPRAVPDNKDHPKATSAGISRSNSFFSSLNKFSPRATPVTKDHPRAPPAKLVKQRKNLERLVQTPTTHQSSALNEESKVTPNTHQHRSSNQIKQHSLMAPINPPPPKSSTVENLTSEPSTKTPGFMRSTSSSAARHIGRLLPRSSLPVKVGTTPTPPRRRTSVQAPPMVNFSLPSTTREVAATQEDKISKPSLETVTEGGMEASSTKLNTQTGNQPKSEFEIAGYVSHNQGWDDDGESDNITSSLSIPFEDNFATVREMAAKDKAIESAANLAKAEGVSETPQSDNTMIETSITQPPKPENNDLTKDDEEIPENFQQVHTIALSPPDMPLRLTPPIDHYRTAPRVLAWPHVGPLGPFPHRSSPVFHSHYQIPNQPPAPAPARRQAQPQPRRRQHAR